MIIKLAWEKKWKHLNKLSLLRRLSLVKGYDSVIVKICSFIVSGNHLEIVPSFSRYVAWFFAHFYPSHQHRNLCEQAHIWVARERRRATRSGGTGGGNEPVKRRLTRIAASPLDFALAATLRTLVLQRESARRLHLGICYLFCGFLTHSSLTSSFYYLRDR